MTAMQSPIARRYWLANFDAITAIDSAVNPPDWGESPVPMTIMCLDSAALAAVKPQAGDDNDLELVDASDEGAFASVFAGLIAKEEAAYVQISGQAIEDFPASMSLVLEKLAEDEPTVLASTLLAVSRYRTDMPEETSAVASRTTWVATSQLRALLSGLSDFSPDALIAAIDAKIAALEAEPMPLVTGAFYRNESEQAPLSDTERDVAFWRAKAAVAASEIDRLQSEKRVRAGREAALRARHDRDLAQQADRSRGEIERLHRAAGWAGRWRARLARIFGRK